jgi:hypothetical protein
MHPRRANSVAGKLHIPLSDIKFGRVKADDRKLHVSDHESHSWWRSALDKVFALL